MSSKVIPWENALFPGETLVWTGTPQGSSVICYLLTNIVILAGIAFLSWTGIDDNQSGGGSGRAFVGFWFCLIGAIGYFALLLLYMIGFHRIAYGATNKETLVFRSIGFSWVTRRNFDPDLEVKRSFLFKSATIGKVRWWGLFPIHFMGIDDESFGRLQAAVQGRYSEKLTTPSDLTGTNP